MNFKQIFTSGLLGAALLFPNIAATARDISNYSLSLEDKIPLISTNYQRPKLNIEFFVDDIPQDRASSQYYSDIQSNSSILNTSQILVSQLFSSYDIEVNIKLRKGNIFQINNESTNITGQVVKPIRLFYLKKSRLKEFYSQEPKRFFADMEKPGWLEEYNKLNNEKLRSFIYTLSDIELKRVIENGLVTKFQEEWDSYISSESSHGLVALISKKAFIYPLQDSSSIGGSENDQINSLSLLEFNQLVYILSNQNYDPANNSNRSGIGNILSFNSKNVITLNPDQLKIIIQEIKRLESNSK